MTSLRQTAMRKFAHLVPQALGKLSRDPADPQGLQVLWRAVAGPAAEHSRAVSLRAGRLTVVCAAREWQLTLAAKRNELRDRMKDYVDVTSIEFVWT